MAYKILCCRQQKNVNFFFPLWEQIIKLEHTYDFFNAI